MNFAKPLFPKKNKVLLFFVPDDITFLVQRKHMAQAALDANFEVHVACLDTGFFQKIREMGIIPHRIRLERGSLNPWRDLWGIVDLAQLILKLRPDVLHNVSLKPVCYGSVVGSLGGVPRIIGLVNGIGYIALGGGLKRTALRWIAHAMYRFALSQKRVSVIFQNADDQKYFIEQRLCKPRMTILIPGSGVDTEKFAFTDEVSGPQSVLFVGRLMRSKGIFDLLEAIKILRTEKNLPVTLSIVGEGDTHNPDSLSEDELVFFKESGIDYYGYQSNLAPFYKAATVVCLPSYREGLPLVVLEALATGRAVVVTDVPGCKDVVEDGQDGLLVPVRSPRSIAIALEKLLSDSALRKRMATNGRKKIESLFTKEIIKSRLIRVYLGESLD